MMDADQTRWLLEHAQAIRARVDEMERIQRVQLNELKAELKAIYWVACWCGLAAIVYVLTVVVGIFR